MSRLPGLLQTATTTGTPQGPSVGATPLSGGSGPVQREPAPLRRRSPMERRLLVVGGTLLGGVLAAIVLAASLSDAVTSRTKALEARLANQAILAQVEAGRREVEFAQTPAYLSFAARSFGWGTIRERAFALKPGGPPPPVIEPLGARPAPASPSDPLQSVLDLLFER